MKFFKLLFLLVICLSLSTCLDGPYIAIEDEYWISTINPDGSELFRIKQMGSHNVQFSPDGSKIIINNGARGIWTMNPDGSEYTLITDTVKVSTILPSTCNDSIGTMLFI